MADNTLNIEKAMGNIRRELPVDVSSDDYSDTQPFFIRAETAGVIRYIPADNQDDEIITKTFEASVDFTSPVMCRKILAEVVTSPAISYASGIYVGYGI